eukprot:Gregarina_sp_Poly_1__11148@NODE_905_length_5764_cov_9_157627_g645_i0_p2_GENE_NODE_905_length_5764_cov_9_157627_g645_i0NODE_905_length_5764_cov_9_157627_g645_i0_p2_ORF_typecomplete_len373_score49_26_NODE_905_length_5764_cov_9_157627_g645_i045295647
MNILHFLIICILVSRSLSLKIGPPGRRDIGGQSSIQPTETEDQQHLTSPTQSTSKKNIFTRFIRRLFGGRPSKSSSQNIESQPELTKKSVRYATNLRRNSQTYEVVQPSNPTPRSTIKVANPQSLSNPTSQGRPLIPETVSESLPRSANPQSLSKPTSQGRLLSSYSSSLSVIPETISESLPTSANKIPNYSLEDLERMCDTGGEFCQAFIPCRNDPKKKGCEVLKKLYHARGIFTIFENYAAHEKLMRLGILEYLKQLDERMATEKERRQNQDQWEVFMELGMQSDKIKKHFPKRIFCNAKGNTLCREVNKVMYQKDQDRWEKPSHLKGLEKVLRASADEKYFKELKKEDNNPQGKQEHWNWHESGPAAAN